MLYERWRQTVRERSSETAVSEFPSGRRWTFAQLAQAVETLPPAGGSFLFAQGHSAQFILDVLRSWRDQVVLCPLEIGQSKPALSALPKPACHLKLTSATTGAARAVSFTAEQLAADAENIVATMGLRPGWPNLGAISLAHSYGFSNLVLPLLLHGIPLALVAAPLPEMIRSAAAAVPAVTLPGVPAIWRSWRDAGAIPRNVRLAISAGAPLSLALESAVFEAGGLKIHNFYGSTECGGIAYDASATPRTDESCVGSPMQNVKLDRNAEGCLRVLSRAAGQSYWPDPDETLRGGSFQTSDLAEFRDGLVYLRGRLSDVINVAGRKVAPDAIEQVLRKHPAVAECVVFGAPGGDAERAEIVVACVVARTPASAAQLKQFLLNQLPAWQVPRDWRFVDSLNASARGKISRAEWRRQFTLQD